jgi:hypothetical protein
MTNDYMQQFFPYDFFALRFSTDVSLFGFCIFLTFVHGYICLYCFAFCTYFFIQIQLFNYSKTIFIYENAVLEQCDETVIIKYLYNA